jgi:hypothetical protein
VGVLDGGGAHLDLGLRLHSGSWHGRFILGLSIVRHERVASQNPLRSRPRLVSVSYRRWDGSEGGPQQPDKAVVGDCGPAVPTAWHTASANLQPSPLLISPAGVRAERNAPPEHERMGLLLWFMIAGGCSALPMERRRGWRRPKAGWGSRRHATT